MRPVMFALYVASIVLVGCSHQKDVSGEPRFRNFTTKNIKTKKDLRLYGFSYQASAQDLHDLTTVDKGDANLIGIVPSSHPVKLKKIIRCHEIGITWEELQGEINFNGSFYAFRFDLGTSAYPNKWRRIFDSFEEVE